MTDADLRALLREALTAMEAGPGAPCRQAQADGFPCDELGHDCTECDYGRSAILAWIEETSFTGSSAQLPGGDW